MTKRLIIFIGLIGLTILCLLIGYILLVSHYRKNGDRALFLSGDYTKAINYYNKLIWWQPFTSGNYFNRGDAYTYDNQYQKAIKDFEKSLQLGIDDSLQALLRIALNAKRIDDTQMAEKRLLQLLKLSKKTNENEFWAANYHLGQIEFQKSNYRRAIEYYNVAHATKPSSFVIYHRANAYFALGILDSAKQDFNKSIQFVKKDFVEKYPNSSIAQCDICGFEFGSKEYELLTEVDGETMIAALEKYSGNEEIRKLKDQLKATPKNNR